MEIVINPNGTSPSECRHFICWHTKGHLWIEGCLNTIDGHDIRCIHYPPSFPFLPFYMLIATHNSFHSNSCTYVTISIAYRVLYVSIVIATRVHQRTWVSFKQIVCHMRVAYINSRVHLDSTLKNIKHN